MQNLENKKRMETWKVQSSDEKGFHKVTYCALVI